MSLCSKTREGPSIQQYRLSISLPYFRVEESGSVRPDKEVRTDSEGKKPCKGWLYIKEVENPSQPCDSPVSLSGELGGIAIDSSVRRTVGRYLNRSADPSNVVWLTNLSKFRSITSLKISSASSGAYQNTE